MGTIPAKAATLAAARFVRAATSSEVESNGMQTVQVEGHTIVLVADRGKIYAVDNRCPHMGFPLNQGSVCDGILTCHWHHARFDLASGGTFDQWADDVRAFPVEIRDGQIWVDVAPRGDLRGQQIRRLRDGLERNISLVIAKAVISLLDQDGAAPEPFSIGLEFGTRYRRSGWGQGLTILACAMNLLPYLDREDRPRALYHGLSAVASDSDGVAPRFPIRPLPDTTATIPALKSWFRQFVEVRDDEGAERCIVSAVRAGADHRQLADILFTAATDHRYIQVGHVLDFTNKALESLDTVGWDSPLVKQVLSSLATAYAHADRMEESNAWRNPVDLVMILERAFEELPAAVQAGQERTPNTNGSRRSNEGAMVGDQDAESSLDNQWAQELVMVILGEDPHAIVEAMLEALRAGLAPERLAGIVAYAAALRIARFHTSNEFSDWDTALHTFTFANAAHMGLRRVFSVELLRGVFDAAMSVYLDRFLNVPPARLPEPDSRGEDLEVMLRELSALLDRQQQVNQAGHLVAGYAHAGGDERRLLARLGHLLLREDRDFHTIQTVEAAFRQYELLRGTPASIHVLVAATRYLAAHAPTVRAQGQRFQIAQRLHRGERLFEG